MEALHLVQRLRLLLLTALAASACAEPGSPWPDARAPAAEVGAGPIVGDGEGTDPGGAPDAVPLLDAAAEDGLAGDAPPALDDGTADGDADAEPADLEPTDAEPTDAISDAPDAPDGLAGDVPPVSDLGDGVADGATDADAVPSCDDKNPCTLDEWIGQECVNTYVYGICCTANPMCDDADPCTADVCVEGFCTHAPSCCADDAACDDGDAICTTDHCVEGTCIHKPTGDATCCAPIIYVQYFDQGAVPGLEVANSDAEVGWHITTSESHSESGSLWYGSETGLNYDSGGPNSGTATFPEVTLPPGVVSMVTFSLLLDVELHPSFDVFQVRVLPIGEPATVVWDKSQAFAAGTWTDVQADLSVFAGKTVRLQLRFDTVDGQVNITRGVFVDDWRVTSTCQAVTCTADTQCDDGLGATEDRCLEGICAHVPDTGYCNTSAECDDGEPCTYNLCSSNTCTYPPVNGCCIVDAECDDGNGCTADDCQGSYPGQGGTCNHVGIPDCCTAPAVCDDGDPCTADSCPAVGAMCQHDPIPGCCQQHEDCTDGDACTEDLCVQGACAYPTLCCVADSDCDLNDPLCTVESCDNGVCRSELIVQPGCCLDTLLLRNFTGPSMNGFTVVGDDDLTDGVSWKAIAGPAHSPGGALYYGKDGTTYATPGKGNRAVALSEAFMLPSTAISRLSFWLLLDNEWANGDGSIEWDRLRVLAVRADGSADSLLLWDSAWGTPVWWTEGPTGARLGAAWVQVLDVDLTPLKGRIVRLRFEFDTIDADLNATTGVFVDDVTVTTTCRP